MSDFSREPMVDLFVFETTQLIEQLEQLLLACERANGFQDSIDESFRIMHTIKGSASMMLYPHISDMAHAIEDLFAYLRGEKPEKLDQPGLVDIVLDAVDFIKGEIETIVDKRESTNDPILLIEKVNAFLASLKEANHCEDLEYEQLTANPNGEDEKYYVRMAQSTGLAYQCYHAVIRFTDDCEMEDIRAFSLVHNLHEIAVEIKHEPVDLCNDPACVQFIKTEGLKVAFRSEFDLGEVRSFLLKTPFLNELDLHEATQDQFVIENPKPKKQIVLDDPTEAPILKHEIKETQREVAHNGAAAGIISVNITKMDKLMDLVGELVIAEAIVTQNPELKGIKLNQFHKAARQLRKITDELQDIVMAIRMVPLAATFQKMNRLVRDMSHKLNKDVQLEILGEETEVDKNIIEHLSDPLMHLIRNSMDHGLETPEERLQKGKSAAGTITLEAKSAGGDVWIVVRDDGRGLNKEKILQKAKEHGMLNKPEIELTDREIYAFVLAPGFSTKEKVTEFSGRGVGMDVVMKNIQQIGGTVLIDSMPDVGAVFSIKIPLTLAIIDGMTIQVGNARYTLPTISIMESFRPKSGQVIIDPDGNEMIMIRGECYPILRLHRIFNVQTDVAQLHDGIIIVVESGGRNVCISADSLLGEQQVVVKPLPAYIKKVKGLTGCTLLGDGSISLILDSNGLAEL